jgi:peptide/nickel transport system substrate-binding protein
MSATLLVAGALIGVSHAADIPRDTVVMAKRIDGIQSLDPAEVYEVSGLEAVGNLYDRLLDEEPGKPGHWRPSLALSWQVDAAGLRYTFKMRRGVRFASGNLLTAADAAFSLQRAIKLDRMPAQMFRPFGLTPETADARIAAPDEETLVIETARPLAPSLLYQCLTAAGASIVDRREVLAHAREGDWGADWLATHSAGSGPYGLKLWRPGERYTLDAVADYWNGAPKNRRVIVLDIADGATQRLMLGRGDVDYARDLDKDQIEAIAHDPAIAIDRGVQSSLVYLALNQADPLLRRPGVVEALKYLIDDRAIVRHVLGGGAIVHQSVLPIGFLGADDRLAYLPDVDRARRLLAAAGLPDGFEVSLDVPGVPPWIDIAQALQANLAQARVRLAILPGEGKATLTKYRARRHQLFLGEWQPDYPDSQSNADAFAVAPDLGADADAKTLAWRNGWQDDAAQRLAAAAGGEADVERRALLLGELQDEVQRRGPYIFLFQHVEQAAHRRDVDGLVIGASADHIRYAGIAKP